ncbi:MAG: VOC family protein [Vicinamibacterales bacterium]
MLTIETLHHVSLPVSDIDTAMHFYGNVLGLQEIPRPHFSFRGAWYRVRDRDLHLIVAEHPTFRAGKDIDSHDIHFAVRVKSYRRAVEYLSSKGFAADDNEKARPMRLNPTGRAGFPQIYILIPTPT